MQAPNAINDQFLKVALLASDEAAAVARKYFRRGLSADAKADASPVTLADKEIETAIRKVIMQNCPDHGILGEEHAHHQPDAAYQWVVDPIDGTRSFMAGYPIFATLIALAFEGKPLIGVVSQPITGERWIASPERPTNCMNLLCKVRNCTDMSKAVLATTSEHYFTYEQVEAYAKLCKMGAHRVSGGDAYAYAMLASGQLDMVVDASLKPYDFAAVVPVVENAGGIITDWKGEKLTIHSEGKVLASATSQLHEQALAVLSAV